MTFIGRGRGWVGVLDKVVPLRRPGEMAATNMEADNLIEAIQGITLSGSSDGAEILRNVEELLKDQCQTEDGLRSVVQRLHDRSLEDRQFGMKAAAAYATVSTHEVDGVKLRNVVLQAVQKDFENKAHLQTACNSKFLNAISLLGEIFHRVRMPDGSPINILATAVLQYQDLLLAGEEHEMELFTTELAVNGRKLYDCRAAELEELMLRVRSTLMSRNLSGQCRCWLLLALDLAANRYAPLSGQLQSFYQVHLGANAIMQLQRVQLGLTVDIQNSHTAPSTKQQYNTNSVQLVDNGDGILAKCKLPKEDLNIENGVVIRPSMKVIKNVTSPTEEHRQKKVTSPLEERSGARKHNHDMFRKKGSWKRDDSKSDDIWGTARGEKGVTWGHDDRFTKDDDFYGKQAQRGEGASRPRIKDSSNWRERKSSDGGKEQKPTIVVSAPGKEQKPAASVSAPPLLSDEETWD